MNGNDRLTLICFRRKSGKTCTLSLSPLTARFFIVACLIVYAIAGLSTYLTINYFYENRGLVEEMWAVEKANATMKAAIKTFNQTGLFSEKESPAARDKEGKQGKKAPEEKLDKSLAQQTPSTSPTATQTEATVEQTPLLATPSPDEADISKGPIAVENISITESGSNSAFTVAFDVVRSDLNKKTSEGRKLSGYVFIVWKTKDGTSSVSKGGALKNSLPVDYKSGEGFDIRFRKQFTHTIGHPDASVEKLSLIVYNKKGELILRKNVKLR
jgi:hypothetical protein